MVVKLMGMADLLAALVVILAHYHLIAWRISIIVVAYLILKGIIFWFDFNSLLDIISGVYILALIIFDFQSILSWILAAYLLQKAVFSLV